MSALVQIPRGRLLSSMFVVFVLVAAGRLVFGSLFAESVPYWDQWDAEGARLFKPWLEGQLTWAQLLSPHNEHRVLFSRLLSLALLEANGGQWDNLVLVHANAFVYAAIATLVFALLAPGLPARWQRLALAAALCLLAWLPFGHTNALVGFQNQFFFMTGMAAATIGVAALGRDHWRTPVLAVVLAVAGLFTMASGLLAAVVAGGVLLLRAWQRDLRPATALAGTAALAVVAVSGYLLIPHLSGHDALKADSAATWLKVFALNMGWPLRHGALGMALVWLPFVFACARVFGRTLPRPVLVAFGLGAWVALQCAAIAYSRGGEATIVGRYVDTLAMGLVANFALALYLAHGRLARGASGGALVAAAVPIVYAGLVFGQLLLQAPGHLGDAAHKSLMSQLQSDNVRRFVANGQRAQLDQPFMEVPYPDPERLVDLLSDPTLRRILPATVRAPLRPVASQAQGFVLRDRLHTFGWSSCAGTDCARVQGQWWGDFAAPAFDRVVLPQWVGPASAGLSVAAGTAGTTAGAARLPTATGVLAVGRAPFRLTVTDASPDNWIAFGAPTEIGPLSTVSRRLQAWVRGRLGNRLSVPDVRRQALLPVSGKGERKPVRLSPGETVETRLLAPRTGVLEGLSVVIGNYGGKADGDLIAEVCTTVACATGRTRLDHSLDNSPVLLPLSTTLPLMHGGPVRVRLRTEHATHRVALWAFARKPDSPQLQPSPQVDAQTARAQALRLGLGYQQ